MLLFLDQAQMREDLAGARLSCPSCRGGTLRPWGWAEARTVRVLDGLTIELAPRRARCGACRRTHVLLPGWYAPRRAHAIEVIGTALAGHLAGRGHRAIAADLDVAADTVRGWLRRLADHARQLRETALRRLVDIDPDASWIPPAHSALADAANTLAALVDAVRRRFAHPAEQTWTLLGILGLAHALRPARSG